MLSYHIPTYLESDATHKINDRGQSCDCVCDSLIYYYCKIKIFF